LANQCAGRCVFLPSSIDPKPLWLLDGGTEAFRTREHKYDIEGIKTANSYHIERMTILPEKSLSGPFCLKNL
jgi:hypothetical protein